MGVDLIFWDSEFRALWLTIAVELVLVVSQLIFLTWLARRRTFLEQQTARFKSEMTAGFYEATNDAAALDVWVNNAKGYPSSTLREFLLPYLQATRGDVRSNTRLAYVKLGLLAQDIRKSRSRLWNRRLIAMRYLWVVAEAEEKDIVLERCDDIYPIRILVGGILARIGATDDFLGLISQLQVPRRVMEQPIWTMVRDMPAQEFRKVAIRWPDIESSYMRRIVLVRSARAAPLICKKWLKDAAKSDDVNLRIAACGAISELAVSSLVELAVSLLADPAWEVRLHAVDSMARIRSNACLDHLASAAADAAYWVRQKAVKAISSFGAEGRTCLQAIIEEDADSFAVDAAAEEIDRQKRIAAGALA